MMPLRFSLDWDVGVPCTILVSIYAEDGTVAISHGGVEIGQGINTKVSRSPSSHTPPLSLSFSPPLPPLSHSHSLCTSFFLTITGCTGSCKDSRHPIRDGPSQTIHDFH